MPLIGLFLVLIIVVGAVSSNTNIDSLQVFSAAETSAQADNLLIYRNHVSKFADNNPGFVGQVPDATLVLPMWYNEGPGMGNYLSFGMQYVYVTSPSSGLAAKLASESEAITVGINRGGVFYSPRQGNTGINLPSQIPLDAVVIIQ